jgi:hypothetical protein
VGEEEEEEGVEWVAGRGGKELLGSGWMLLRELVGVGRREVGERGGGMMRMRRRERGDMGKRGVEQ